MAPGCRVPVSVPSGMVVSAVGVIQAAVRVPGSGETVGPGFLLWGSRESSLRGPPSSPPPRGLGASHPPEGLKLFPRSFMLRKKKSRRLTIHHGVVMRGVSLCPSALGVLAPSEKWACGQILGHAPCWFLPASPSVSARPRLRTESLALHSGRVSHHSVQCEPPRAVPTAHQPRRALSVPKGNSVGRF